MGIKRYAKRAGKEIGRLSALEQAARRDDISEKNAINLEMRQRKMDADYDMKMKALEQAQKKYETQANLYAQKIAQMQQNADRDYEFRKQQAQQKQENFEQQQELKEKQQAFRELNQSSGTGHRKTGSSSGVVEYNNGSNVLGKVLKEIDLMEGKTTSVPEKSALDETRKFLENGKSEIDSQFGDFYVNNPDKEPGGEAGVISKEQAVYNNAYKNAMRGIYNPGDKAPTTEKENRTRTSTEKAGGFESTTITEYMEQTELSKKQQEQYIKDHAEYMKAVAKAEKDAFDAVKKYRIGIRDAKYNELAKSAKTFYENELRKRSKQIEQEALKRAEKAVVAKEHMNNKEDYLNNGRVYKDSDYYEIWKSYGYANDPSVIAKVERDWREKRFSNLVNNELTSSQKQNSESAQKSVNSEVRDVYVAMAKKVRDKNQQHESAIKRAKEEAEEKRKKDEIKNTLDRSIPKRIAMSEAGKNVFDSVDNINNTVDVAKQAEAYRDKRKDATFDDAAFALGYDGVEDYYKKYRVDRNTPEWKELYKKAQKDFVVYEDEDWVKSPEDLADRWVQENKLIKMYRQLAKDPDVLKDERRYRIQQLFDERNKTTPVGEARF